ncbi:MAG: BamA/TamA family outer membrane protein [Ignavibacteriae bacterium]|nr:BamA/TamA family outer membrane protein [Ignavibacteriota bacterium]
MSNKSQIFILFLLLVISIVKIQNCQNSSINDSTQLEIFPILNYDSDVGFGYGAKGYYYNLLNTGESFDATIYNSTKGERWYQFIYSYPDIQRRQGKKYNLAVDFIFDYDKYINYKYYQNETDAYLIFQNDEFIPLKNVEDYVREPIEIKTILSKAFTNNFISELGFQYRSISCYNFDKDGVLQYKKPSSVQHFSILFNFRLDSRTNYINPHKGYLIQLNNEYAISSKTEVSNFYKIDFILQSYFSIFHPNLIYAIRFKLQGMMDLDENNYQNLIFLGGNNTLRGLPQNRYLSQSSLLLNQELRFPIWKRINGIFGLDIGNSTSTPEWIIIPVTGLRFNMDNFIVRFDVGFGNDFTGIYFNFGHLF